MSADGFNRFRARFAATTGDVARAQALRARRFRNGVADDVDAHDAGALHLLVEEAATGRLAACCRLRRFAGGADIGASYSARFYDLSALARRTGPMAEVGRFCVADGAGDPAVLRVAWGALAAWVAAERIEFLFGCSSFAGVDEDAYADAFALLRERHLAPRRWLPRVKAPAVFRFARALRRRKPDLAAAMRAMPPLLRSYLAMGGRVSDHAVVDRDLGTLHVFTGVEVAAVPPARARSLRAAAGPSPA